MDVSVRLPKCALIILAQGFGLYFKGSADNNTYMLHQYSISNIAVVFLYECNCITVWPGVRMAKYIAR